MLYELQISKGLTILSVQYSWTNVETYTPGGNTSFPDIYLSFYIYYIIIYLFICLEIIYKCIKDNHTTDVTLLTSDTILYSLLNLRTQQKNVTNEVAVLLHFIFSCTNIFKKLIF